METHVYDARALLVTNLYPLFRSRRRSYILHRQKDVRQGPAQRTLSTLTRVVGVKSRAFALARLPNRSVSIRYTQANLQAKSPEHATHVSTAALEK